MKRYFISSLSPAQMKIIEAERKEKELKEKELKEKESKSQSQVGVKHSPQSEAALESSPSRASELLNSHISMSISKFIELDGAIEHMEKKKKGSFLNLFIFNVLLFYYRF